MIFGAIEAGGTKFVCAISDETLKIKERISIPTTTPEETLAEVFNFFDTCPVDAIGIGSFGPIDVNPLSETYGSITSTPKPGWKNFPFLKKMKERYDIPYGWTTDVNAAAYGEIKKGAAIGKNSCIYITVGTGIGAGVVVDSKVIHGFGHPEAGHILVKRDDRDNYEGTCPYHKDCLEGIAAGPAIGKRFGVTAQELPENHVAWEIEAYYLAQALVNYTLVLSPEKIIFGGGVMKQTQLFPLIYKEFSKLMNGYVSTPSLEEYIVLCALGDNAGITGCLLLAQDAIKSI
ncbi:ROK family protein [Vagococcus carniphilus]|uniref:ROK family protein n=1 Tax=Vagococcus carniphilus TaxID=218144 RepID=UPI00288F378D|nr:ROK family protein [Vagococcus carniphilus]MDT2831601.1 ROK family protein [Vagococcus carniphilus]MDT2840491.1 ROK family protein [Vagococcus carniphilus]MDT2855149.1 ROK family protein [Vagococcus carniphilus]